MLCVHKIASEPVQKTLYNIKHSRSIVFEARMKSWLIYFCLVSSIINICYCHASHILQEQEYNDVSMSKVVKHYLKVFSNGSRLMIIRMKDADFQKPSKESSPSIFSRDVTISPDRMVYNFNFFVFRALWVTAKFTQETFTDCDFIIIIDTLTSVKVNIPSLLGHEDRLLMIVTAQQNSSVFQTVSEPSMLLLEDRGTFFFIQDSKTNECGIPFIDFRHFYLKSTKKLYPVPDTVLMPKNLENHTVGTNYSCAIGFLFFTYKLFDSTKLVEDYVTSHPTYQIMLILIPTSKTRLMLWIKAAEKHKVRVDYKDPKYSHFFYNDLYWYPTDDVKFGNNPLLCFGMEDVVWIVVNPSDAVINWNMVIVAAILVSCTILGSFTLEHAIGYKLPLQSIVLMMWSIFLSVSAWRQPKRYVLRVLFFSWTLSSSVLTLCYYFKLFNALSYPSVIRYHNNAEVLESSIFKLTYESGYLKMARETVQNFKRAGESATVGRAKSDFFSTLNEYAESGTEFALLLDSKHVDRIIPHLSGAPFYRVAQKVISYPNCIYSSYEDRLTSQFLKRSARLKAAGILEQLSKNSKRKENTIDERYPSKISLTYMLNIYILVGVLYLIATVFFFGEIAIFNIKKRTRRTQGFNGIILYFKSKSNVK